MNSLGGGERGGSIERVFLGWDEPLPPLAARFLADRYRAGDVIDMKPVALVMPGSRAGRRLKELLLGEARDRGCRLVPPRIVRVADVAELFYTPLFPPADSFVLLRVWCDVLREAKADLDRVFGDLPADDDLRGWHLLARKVALLQKETAAGGHLFRDVARVCATGGELLFDDSERWLLLAALQEEYRARLSARATGDADLNRIEALEVGEFQAEVDVWLVGVAELPPAVARIVDAARGRIGALVHAPPSEADSFDELGLVRTAAWRTRDFEIPDTMLRVVDRPGDQAAATLDELARLGETPTREVVVAVPSEGLVPYLKDWLESAGLPTHYAGGTPIVASGPFRLLEAVAEYLDRGEWGEFSALMRHPDLENWLERRRRGDYYRNASPDQLDRAFEIHLPARLRTSAIPGLFRTRIEEVRDVVEGAELLGRFREPEIRPLNEWAERIVGFLAEVYGAKDYAQSLRDRRELRVLEEIRNGALYLHRLPPDLSPHCRAADAIRILLDEIRSTAVPEDPEGAPIELLGWLELPADDAPHVIVTGLNEGIVPEARNADAFLPDRLRQRLGLPNNDSRYARDAFHLAALLHSRRTLRLISGRLSETGDPLRPSRLLLTCRGEQLARRVLLFTEVEEHGAPREAPIAAMAGMSSQFQLPPAKTLTFEPPDRLMVTAFRSLIEDPYRFVLERIYRLRAHDDEARELDPPGFGTLAHAVLERFGASRYRAETDPRVIYEHLCHLLDAEVDERFGSATFPAVHIQIEHLRLRLRAFAEWQAGRTRDGWQIVLVEGNAPKDEEAEDAPGRDPTTIEVQFDVDGRPITLAGRIDRIDHNPETGAWALLDYKTGEKVEPPDKTHRKRSGEWKDLQLPLYRHLARSIEDKAGRRLIPDDAPLELGYIALPRDLGRVGELMAPWSKADLADADETARALVRQLRTGSVTFDRSKVVTPWERDPFVSLFGLRLLLTAELEDGIAAGVEG